MRAMVLEETGALRERAEPLVPRELDDPEPGPGEALLRVSVCGVCHTELDVIEGRTPPRRLPLVLGHQVVGRVEALGEGASRLAPGQRVGVAWIYSACGSCSFCREGRENLCPDFVATGRDVDGGYAERMRVPEAFAHPLPDVLEDEDAAPLLCAGAVGYRSLALARLPHEGALGLTGFGASGHLVLKMARHVHPDCEVFVFARDPEERAFAEELGAVWSGPIGTRSPRRLHAIIDTTPVWKPVVEALEDLEAGGRLVINAIRKEDGDRDELARLDYARHLWLEKELKSVANVTRDDVRTFLALAAEMEIRPERRAFPLEEANRALQELRAGRLRGAKVLRPGS